MPVARICASVDCSTNGGASRWMGSVCLLATGPRSSTGSPMTLRIRPSVSGPTGMAIGPPVSTALSPRTSPSVVSMATVRTSASPRCCATSSTSLRPSVSTCSAFRMFGISASPSKRTSTTAPVIWVIVPMLLEAMMSPFPNCERRGLESLGAGNDLDEFRGDRRLARAVHLQGDPLDHVAGVAAGVVHRGHLRAIEARSVLQQHAEDLHGDVAWQQIGQDLALARLELVDRAAGYLFRHVGRRRRNQLLAGDDLRHRRSEAVEDHRGDVELAGLEHVQDPRRHLLGISVAQPRTAKVGDRLDDEVAVVAAQLIAAPAPDRQHLDRLALVQESADGATCLAHDRAVERAAQAAV